jgi:peptidyl-prolyl cis-trans isomerase B (cyclophilin B)
VTTKRERDLDRAKAARQLQRHEEEQRRRRLLIGGAAVIVVALLGLLGVRALAGDDATPPDASSTAQASPTGSASLADCEDAGDLQTSAKQFPDGPGPIALSQAVLGLQIDTNCGRMEVEFAADRAPENTKAMIFLANTGAPVFSEPGNNQSEVINPQGYFDNTACHRLTTAGIFVLQCGDPTGTGTGSPGFTTNDESLDVTAEEFEGTDGGRVIYPKGTVAMANSGPNTNGSQFFIVYEDSPLPPAYTVIGRVVLGLDIVEAVAKAGVEGDGEDGRPAQTLELTKVNSFERREVAQGG